ncbi:hypothetical protein NCAS_0A05610 [Naumovozyma castellii]|uniref:Small ribosomal subunit protein bS6m n=1 Tax=Naumovozyma castellii TaxID=27288 RepID=G0V6M3_NAUCA|nr:hypothetical protein NCAS_0A05610 [Naumovozyma castellii CBS 4309]CCC67119.1 hypothetical protein NCAS_0A05610 [Naumovozyma castellii CBS 4309]
MILYSTVFHCIVCFFAYKNEYQGLTSQLEFKQFIKEDEQVKMLYELIGIVRILDPVVKHKEAKELITTIGKLVINNRGVIRNIIPMKDSLKLPKIMTKDQEQHFQGYHFMMLFDSSPAVQSEILRTLKKDPRVIRSSIIKVNTEKELDVAPSLDKISGFKSVLEKVNNSGVRW